MRFRFHRILASVGSALVALAVASSCSDSNNMTGNNPTATPTNPPAASATPTATAPAATATPTPPGATATPTRTATAGPTLTPTSVAAGYAGTWDGTWNNTTFGSSGSAHLVSTVNTAAQTFTATLTLGGNVFGTTAPPPQNFSGSYATGSFSQAGTAFGDITINFPSPGNFTGFGVNVPNPNIARIDFNGTATTSSIHMNYTITFSASAGGGTAVGTMTLNKTS